MGRMNVKRFLLHGPPGSGKSSCKRLAVNDPPVKLDSTKLIEDPLRAICTLKLMSIGEKYGSLEEIDEEKLIRMLQREVQEAIKRKNRKGKTTRPLQEYHSSHYSPTSSTTVPASTFPHGEVISSSQFTSSKPKSSSSYSEVLRQIAADLNSIDPNTPSLFQCNHIHLVDSGGQPQFSNLLPLVFQSQHHHHLVVIRLDEKLNDKPINCFEVDGVKHVLPESLMLTNYQLIERVCQLASGSDSRVIVIGTHLHVESKEEPLAKKMELLQPLMKKYEDNLVLTEEGEPIFAVNAMAPVGEEREKYSRILQEVILSVPSLCDEGSDDDDDGIPVPLSWIVLELELSRRSKVVGGILEKSEIEEIARDLEIDDLPEALEFFWKLTLHYH